MVRNKLEERGRKQKKRHAVGMRHPEQRQRGETAHGHLEQRWRGETDSAWTGLQDPESWVIMSIYRLKLEPKSHGAVIGCFRG